MTTRPEPSVRQAIPNSLFSARRIYKKDRDTHRSTYPPSLKLAELKGVSGTSFKESRIGDPDINQAICADSDVSTTNRGDQTAGRMAEGHFEGAFVEKKASPPPSQLL